MFLAPGLLQELDTVRTLNLPTQSEKQPEQTSRKHQAADDEMKIHTYAWRIWVTPGQMTTADTNTNTHERYSMYSYWLTCTQFTQ